MTSEKGANSFFGVAQEKVYYDERKKRFFSSKDAPAQMMRSANSGFFKDQRPDLYG